MGFCFFLDFSEASWVFLSALLGDSGVLQRFPKAARGLAKDRQEGAGTIVEPGKRVPKVFGGGSGKESLHSLGFRVCRFSGPNRIARGSISER